MLIYSDIIQQKREERKKYIDQLNAMYKEHNIDGLRKQYALEIHDHNALLEKMQLFSEFDGLEYPPFASKEEYVATRKKLIGFAERKTELLNAATTIYTYEENIRRCNAVFEKSILDEGSYIAQQNDAIHTSSKQLLKNANNFGKYLTSDFLLAINKSAINSLTQSEIENLVEDGYISTDEIEAMFENPGIAKKLAGLHDMFDVHPPVTEVHEIRLKGVSYNNEDGSSRQEYLKELANAEDKSITIKPFMFHNSKENRDEPAANVMWGEKCIGNLPALFMMELDERLSNITFSAEIDKVVGGGDFNYGCHITLTVTGKSKNAPHKIDLKQFVSTENAADKTEEQSDKNNEYEQAQLNLS